MLSALSFFSSTAARGCANRAGSRFFNGASSVVGRPPRITITGDQDTNMYFERHLRIFKNAQSSFQAGYYLLARNQAEEALDDLMRVDTVTTFKMQFLNPVRGMLREIDDTCSSEADKGAVNVTLT